MKFALYDHAGKGGYLRQRLLDAGHEETEDPEVVLLDCDWPWAHPRPAMIQLAKDQDAKVVLYPHGGRPTAWVYDGIAEPDERVDMRFEHGQGSVEMAGIFNDALTQSLYQQATGWLFSPTREFEPVEKPKRILFAPLHPNIEMIQKRLPDVDPAPLLNNRIYKDLLGLKGSLVVSLAGPMFRTGVWQHPKAKLIQNPTMSFEQSYQQILDADVVIGAGTIAATAIALGKPTVMLDQDTFADYVNGEYVPATHSDEFTALVRYPLDATEGNLVDVIAAACEGSSEVQAWRDRWVGTDGTGKAIELIEGLVGVLSSRNVTIQGATATSKSAA